MLAQVDARWQELQAISRKAAELLGQRGQWRGFPDPQPAGLILERHPMQRFTHALELAGKQFNKLSAQKAPRLFGVACGLTIIAGLLFAACPSIPAAALTGPVRLALGGHQLRHRAAVLFFVVDFWLHVIARRQSAQAYLPLRRTLLEAGIDRPGVLEAAHADCRRLFAAIVARHRAEIRNYRRAVCRHHRRNHPEQRTEDSARQTRHTAPAWRRWSPSVTRR